MATSGNKITETDPEKDMETLRDTLKFQGAYLPCDWNWSSTVWLGIKKFQDQTQYFMNNIMIEIMIVLRKSLTHSLQKHTAQHYRMVP